MVQITKVDLKVGRRTNNSLEFADVAVKVEWTQREVSENLAYYLSIYLVEQDDPSFYDMRPDGSIHWHSNGNGDDYVGTVISDKYPGLWVRPDGRSVHTFTYDRDWEFGDQERGDEEYKAIATIVPEIRGDISSSSRVIANLG